MKTNGKIGSLLILLILLISSVSAANSWVTNQTVYNFGVTWPVTMGPVSGADADTICINNILDKHGI